MKVSVVSRNGMEVIKGGVELDSTAMVSDLQNAIYERNKKLYPSRQRLTLPVIPTPEGKPVVLNPRKKLADYADGNAKLLIVVFKDLGPQVSYRTLFLWEYLGPLLIYPIFFFFPAIYSLVGLGLRKEKHPVQIYALCYWTLHYAKRIAETYFVHKFSHATSPLSNVYRNCAYYWTFAAFIAYGVNHPIYSPTGDLQWKIGLSLGLIFQASNLYCHIILKRLRDSNGGGGYQIPRGFLFNIVTCANYTTEIYQWLCFNIATGTVAGCCFLSVGTCFMYNWSLGKHRRLNKVFDGKDGRPKYPKRWILIPPFY